MMMIIILKIQIAVIMIITITTVNIVKEQHNSVHTFFLVNSETPSNCCCMLKYRATDHFHNMPQ